MRKEVHLRYHSGSWYECHPFDLQGFEICAYSLRKKLELPPGEVDIVAVFSSRPLGKHAFELTKHGTIKHNRDWLLQQTRRRLMELYNEGARYVRVEIAE